jgi:uncharacterized protein YjbJ (UPF0337 family)
MDKHRSKVAADDNKGVAEDIAGKITGHQRLVAEGRLQKQAGRIQQVDGVVRDTPRSR